MKNTTLLLITTITLITLAGSYSLLQEKPLFSADQQIITLGYWDYPGRAQHIRLLLEYTQLPYVEKTYKTSEGEEWYEQDKKSLDLDFPNLPYIIDPVRQVNITESTNIMGYIADIANGELRGIGMDKYKVDNIRFMLDDIGGSGYVSSRKEEDKKIADWQNKYSVKLQQLKAIYGDNLYAMGYLTIADFYVFQRLMDFKTWFPQQYQEELADKFDLVLDNLTNLPGIKEYVNSERYIDY